MISSFGSLELCCTFDHLVHQTLSRVGLIRSSSCYSLSLLVESSWLDSACLQPRRAVKIINSESRIRWLSAGDERGSKPQSPRMRREASHTLWFAEGFHLAAAFAPVEGQVWYFTGTCAGDGEQLEISLWSLLLLFEHRPRGLEMNCTQDPYITLYIISSNRGGKCKTFFFLLH